VTYAAALMTLGRPVDAEAAVQRAADIRTRIGSPIFSSRIPVALARDLLAQGRATEALAVVDDTQSKTRAAAQAHPDQWVDEVLASSLQLERARALLALGQPAEAEKLLRDLLASTRASQSPAFFETLQSDASLALAEQSLAANRLADAASLAKSALIWRQSRQSADSPGLLEAHAILARALLRLGRGAEADEHFREARRIARQHKALGPQYQRLVDNAASSARPGQRLQ